MDLFRRSEVHSVSSSTHQSSPALPSGRLVTRPRKLNITPERQQKEEICNFKIQLQFIPTFA